MSDPNDQPTPPPRRLSGREAYNLVSDTVTGVNVRLRDNLIQGIAILAGLVLGAVVGLLVAADPLAGVFAGGFVGLLAGLFGSGIGLMIYRMVRHARGRHD